MKLYVRNCFYCGKTFRSYRSGSRYFCSRKCYGKWRTLQAKKENLRFLQEEIDLLEMEREA